jgi:hypothetical protein
VCRAGQALEGATRRQNIPERLTIFTDAQTAIRRMASEEPGPGQKYAIQARQWIVALRKARPDIVIEIRWCPAHAGVLGNEKADELGEAGGGGAGAHGMEWLLDGSVRRAPDALVQIPRKHQAGDLREEVDRSPPLGGEPDHRQKVKDAG